MTQYDLLQAGKLVKGSLGDVARQNRQSLAETFVNAEAVVIVDTSSSMDTPDSTEGRSRYEQACLELEALQAHLPGKIAVLSFSNATVFCPSGRPDFLHGSTDLAGALAFAKVADVPGIRIIVISDGQPDSVSEALQVASRYQNKIDTIYVGPEGGYGQDFLARLAHVSGGQFTTADRVKSLAQVTERLLLAG